MPSRSINLLSDVKDYIEEEPQRLNLDWQQTNISDIGSRLVWNNETKYIGDKVAGWTQAWLEPPSGRVDARITVSTPLDKPEAATC